MLKRDIQKILSSCVINPKTDTGFRFVVDLNNPTYCVTKAVDILINIDLNRINFDQVKQAITLLAIAHGCNTPRQTRVSRKPKNRVNVGVQSSNDPASSSGDNKKSSCNS